MQATALAVAPDWVVSSCVGQIRQLYGSQTTPFAGAFTDYAAVLQRSRELEVRLLQLDKEGAELRDENAALHSRLAVVDVAAAATTAAQLEETRAALSRAERELGLLYRDKANLLEEVVGANTNLTNARSALESTTTQLAQARAEVAALRDQLSSLGSGLDSERAARVATAAELTAALGARDAALSEAERLRHENIVLVRRLVELKEGEAGRMNDLNRMHEELLEHAARVRQEAELDRQATEMIRQRAVAAALSGAAAAAAGPLGTARPSAASSVMVSPAMPLLSHAGAAASGGPAGSGAAGSTVSSGSAEWVGTMPMALGVGGGAGVASAASVAGGLGGSAAVPTTLREVMGLLAGSPGGRTGMSYEACPRLPETREPRRTPLVAVEMAHKGGCNSLASQSPGHFVASCGADKAVALWDVALVAGPGSCGAATGMLAGLGAGGVASNVHIGPAVLLHGMTAAVNDCAFTCDAAQVVAAGSDKALHVWDATSGRHRHTLTGHAGAVTAVALSPLDCRLAVSVSEDRSFKLWDLSRGFSVRSTPCAKMPLSLAISRDGNTVATGHLDGSVLLWDVRQCRAGAATPLVEARDQPHPVVALAALPSDDSCLAVAAKDGSLRLWDFRGAAVLRLMRHPGFTLGTAGGTGRPRCRLGVSPDGRLLAAGAADGSVWVWDLRSAGAGGPGADPKQLRGGGGGPSSSIVHRDSVVATAFSSDYSALVSADKAGGLVFWAME